MLAKPGRVLFEQSTGSQNVNDGVATQRGNHGVFKSSVIVLNNTRHIQMIPILIGVRIYVRSHTPIQK